MNRAFSVSESFTVKRVFVRLLCSLPILTWMTSVNAIALLASSSGQKSSFSANWICRERASHHFGLKGEPQGELDLPGGRCGARIRPCRWVETARTGEDLHGARRRRAEGWMIQQVKKFRSKLKRVVISDLEFPLKRDIDIEYGWSKQSVSSKVADSPCLRNTKGAGVKKQVRSSDFLSGFQHGGPCYGIFAA